MDFGSVLCGTLTGCEEKQGRNTSADPLGLARDKR